VPLNLKIKSVNPNSLAEVAGILPGDEMISINRAVICNLLDYKFYSADEILRIKLKRGGKTLKFEIFNENFEDLGLDFEDMPLKSCENNCIFCFINQLPKGLRKSLYFKDDDIASSFLQGNYITLTNLACRDFNSIRKMKINNINISVHSTNPALRAEMMGNKKAAQIMKILRRFAKWGIKINCQIVLVKGVNDGEHLVKTLKDLAGFYPNVQSVSVVPAGITCHRQNLPEIKLFTKDDADEILRIIENEGKNLLKLHGAKVMYAADEFYVLAGREVPQTLHYEEFHQLENGVGLMALFKEEFTTELGGVEPTDKSAEMSIATGVLAAPVLRKLMDEFVKVAPNVKVEIYAIKNKLFGENVTVAGLVCGGDIIKQLSGMNLGEKLLIPGTMLNSDGIFLDNTTIAQVEDALNVKVVVVDVRDGANLVNAILEREEAAK